MIAGGLAWLYCVCIVASKLGENLRRLREAKGLTQQDVADAVGLQTPGPISEYENGTRRPGPRRLKQLAAFFDVKITDIGAPYAKNTTLAPQAPLEEKSQPESADRWDQQSKGGSTVDNLAEVGKIPYSLPTTTAEGPMKDQIEAVVGALGLVDEDKRAAFVAKVKRLAASMVLGLEDAGYMPAKQKRVAGKG